MGKLSSTFSYSIGKKLVMALTGLFLIIFLVVHLIGNLLLLSGPEAFNAYAEFMGHNLFIRIQEFVLFGGFIFHIADGLMLKLQNKKARPVGYAVGAGTKNASWFSKNMATSGVILLIFLVLHLISFFLKARFNVDVNFGADNAVYEGAAHGPEGFSLYHKAALLFSIPWYSIINIVAMVVIGMHLVHGFQSAFQTLGINHPKYTPIIKALGYGYAVLVPAAYCVIPIYFLINPI